MLLKTGDISISNNINHLSLIFGNIFFNKGINPLNPLDVTEKAIAQKAPNQTKISNVTFMFSIYKITNTKSPQFFGELIAPVSLNIVLIFNYPNIATFLSLASVSNTSFAALIADSAPTIST